MAIELKRKVYEFKLEGEVYSVKAPSTKQIMEFSKVDKDQSFEKMIDLFDELGFPKEIALGLDFDLLEVVSETLIPKKKN